MLRTKPLTQLFDRAQEVVARRIRRDRRRASEKLRPVFDHIEGRFYDVDLNLDDMMRRGVVDWWLRECFRDEMGVAIKPYLLQWIEGRLAKVDGDEAIAEQLFRQARAGLLGLGDRVTGALVAVDIAILCNEQGRFPEAIAVLMADVLPVLDELGLDAEARAAIEVLREAVTAEAVSLAALRKAREVLRQVQRDPARAVRLTAAAES